MKLVKKLRPLMKFLPALIIPLLLFTLAVNERRIEAAAPESEYTLVIDPGHGGIDGGAVAADGTKESDINLQIALKLRALAEFYGQNNVMTRQDDSTRSDTLQYSEHRDLVCRTETVNTAANPLLISIHQNCYPTGQPSGAQVLYSGGETGAAFGKLTHGNLIGCLDPQNRRVAEPASDKLYMLSHISCPAILVECGFMSNSYDVNLLKTSQYQTSLASVLMASFLQFRSNTFSI